MAVAFDAVSESHTGTAGNTTIGTYSWTHTPVGSPKGVLAFTFTNANTDATTRVTYANWPLVPVSGGRAVDTAGEPGETKTWLLSGVNRQPAKAMSTGGSGSHTCGYYANNILVLGTSSGGINTTTDPTSTTISAASSPGFGTSQVNSIAYGNDTWVAVGAGGQIRYATDPTGTWTAASSPGFGTASVLSVAYYGGTWVAVGGGGQIRYATDPTGTWSAASSSGVTTTLRCVAYGNGYWVVSGDSGVVRYATDPTGTWSAPSSIGFSPSSPSVYTVAYGGGYWVAFCSGQAARYATDPTGAWSATSLTAGNASYAWFGTYGDGVWMVAGGNASSLASIWTATDPTGTWSAPEGGFPPLSGTQFSFATYGGGWWIVGTGSGGSGWRWGTTNTVTLPTGAKTVAATTTSTDETYAVAISVTADNPVDVYGVVLQQEDQALAATAVNDGSPGTDSMRFAGVNSGLSAPPTPNSGSTEIANIDFGVRVIAVIRETTAGQGSRNIGWTAASDDVAAVYLAVREAIVPWVIGNPI